MLEPSERRVRLREGDASRIAASLYLGDTADVAAATLVPRGFLGDRSAYAGFTHTLDADDLSWACSGSQSTYTPVNPACTKSGINVDGGVVTDISRSGPLTWPPRSTAIQYQLDSIQGIGLQMELLYRNATARRGAGHRMRSGGWPAPLPDQKRAAERAGTRRR